MYWGYQLVVVVVVDRMVLFVQEGFEVLQAVLALAECAMVVCEETSVDLIRSPISKEHKCFIQPTCKIHCKINVIKHHAAYLFIVTVGSLLLECLVYILCVFYLQVP